MQYYRCKCGHSTAWGSYSPYLCDSCSKCGSDLAPSPDSHQTPVNHTFVPYPVETDEGTKYLSKCQYCHRTRKELEK